MLMSVLKLPWRSSDGIALVVILIIKSIEILCIKHSVNTFFENKIK